MKNLAVLRPSWALFGLLLLSACGPDAAATLRPSASAEQPLLGATPTTGFANVGVLVSGTQDLALCTATLVGPKTLLTAVHCLLRSDPISRKPLAQAVAAKEVTWSLATGAPDAAPQQTYRGAELIFPGGELFDFATFVDNMTRGRLNTNDVALVILESAPPSQPANLASAAPTQGEALTLVGYGSTRRYDGDDPPLKRTVTSVVNETEPIFLNTGSRTVGACSGDSGGPAFAAGKLAAVAHAAQLDQAGNCTGQSIYVRADVWGNFVRQNSR